MYKAKSTTIFVILVFSFLNSAICKVPKEFECKKTSMEPLPSFPPAFSHDFRLNFLKEKATLELRHYKDEVGKRESLEIFTPLRHVKYLVHGEQHLFITFPDDDIPTCKVSTSSTIQLEKDDTPDGILQNILDALKKPKEFHLVDAEIDLGVAAKVWEGCFEKINISYSFSENWKYPGDRDTSKVLPVKMEAQIGNDFLVGLVDNFQASMPENIYLQPPENVYCEGFRSDKKPPQIPDYFSYDSETIQYERKGQRNPSVVQRSVYYDYPSRIYRMDFHDIATDMPDVENPKLIAESTSVIHDFNSKVLYSFQLPSLKCEVEDYEVTEGVDEEKNTEDSSMQTGMEYFGLDSTKISYNGEFMTRGYLADVFTAELFPIDGSKRKESKKFHAWYFSAGTTTVVENDKLEKNVLLRKVFMPASGLKGQTRDEENFFNFIKQEPSANKFDIKNCYNEKNSKLFVLTFPANNAFRGSENFLKLAVHLVLIESTGLSKQRISVSEVVFNKNLMFAEFRLLESLTAVKKDAKKTNEPSLAEAEEKLRKAVRDGTLKLSLNSADGHITIMPYKDGFNEFSGDRKMPDPSSYSQASVVGLTIGMLLLGFVLGGVALNLIVSRKFGVSLFQKAKGGSGNFGRMNEMS